MALIAFHDIIQKLRNIKCEMPSVLFVVVVNVVRSIFLSSLLHKHSHIQQYLEYSHFLCALFSHSNFTFAHPTQHHRMLHMYVFRHFFLFVCLLVSFAYIYLLRRLKFHRNGFMVSFSFPLFPSLSLSIALFLCKHSLPNVIRNPDVMFINLNTQLLCQYAVCMSK